MGSTGRACFRELTGKIRDRLKAQGLGAAPRPGAASPPESDGVVRSPGFHVDPRYIAQRKSIPDAGVWPRINEGPFWRIWILPEEFRAARFRDVHSTEDFVRAFPAPGEFGPLLGLANIRTGNDWVRGECDDVDGDGRVQRQCWAIFRSGQFFANISCASAQASRSEIDSDEILDRVEQAFQFARAMAKFGVLDGRVGVSVELWRVAGYSLKSSTGISNVKHCQVENLDFPWIVIESADLANRWDILAIEHGIQVLKGFG